MCQGKYCMSSLCLNTRQWQGFQRFKSMILAYCMQRNDRSILQMCNHFCSQLTIQVLVHVTMDPKPEQILGDVGTFLWEWGVIVFASQHGDLHDTASSATCRPSTGGYCLHLKKATASALISAQSMLYSTLCIFSSIYISSLSLHVSDSRSKNVKSR